MSTTYLIMHKKERRNPTMVLHQSSLRPFFTKLKQEDPLQGVPSHSRQTIASLRCINELLWLAHHMPTTLFPHLNEEQRLLCIQQALADAAYWCAVLCMAYQLDLTTFPVRAKRPNDEIATQREERLQQLLGQVLLQCWSHSRAFTRENLQKTRDLRQHEAGIQLGCTWYVLLELAKWCDIDLVEVLYTYRKKEEQESV